MSNMVEKFHNAKQMFQKSLIKYKRYLMEGIGATIVINILALATSLFSMQVYDRVIPTHGLSTLITLGIGVIMMIFFEFTLKRVRSSIMDSAIVGLDNMYARQIYKRLLSVRLDQMPSSVGSLSSQLKSYETIRGFLTASTLYVFVDTPFAIVYILLLSFIGSPWIALVSFSFFLGALSVGFWLKYRIKIHTEEGARFNNIRIGELVETIQGSEIIKAGNGGQKFLTRWMKTSKAAILNDLAMRHINEDTSYIAALLQQLGYASIVIVGAYLVTDGAMTMGALIACTIISGRIMAPVAALPGLFTQMSHAKTALNGIEQMFALKMDNDGIQTPLAPEKIQGHFLVENIKYVYNKAVTALEIPNLEIKAGEKVAIVGMIGSGKSTLLKILSGLYIPEEGKIFLDNLDISHIERNVLSRYIGFMPQDNRLFQGTLRENLLIGIDDPGDDIIKEISMKTDLLQLVNKHPKGFELPIFEGGTGLSSGQRQIVALTRLLLSNPSVWLLDEPTASMDAQLENRIVQLLKTVIKKEDTAIIVTHKPNILALVDRLIVVNQGKIIMAGPRNEVLAKLSSPTQTTQKEV